MLCNRWGLSLLLGCLFGSALAAEDWTTFRGPQGDGHSAATRTPVEWSATEHVAWKQPVPGQGWSSPVTAGGRIYLTAAVPVGGAASNFSLQLLAFDAKTGNELSSVEIFQQDGSTAPRIHQKNSHASPTPIIDGERLYVHFGHQGTACVSRDGQVLWRNRELPYPPVHGNGGSPILVGNALIFSCDGSENPFIVALNKQTGKVLWKTPRQTDSDRKFSFSTPTLITVDGQQQVISPGSNCVCALDPRDGREIWRVNYDGYSVIPKAVFGHDLIFLSTGYNNPSLLAIRPNGTGDVTATHIAWQTDRQAPHTPSPLLVGDELYLVSDGGIATCLDAATGAEYWQERLGGKFSASPILAAGHIYFLSEEGETHVIQPSTVFEKLASNHLEEYTLASMGVIDNALLIRSEKHLYRIE